MKNIIREVFITVCATILVMLCIGGATVYAESSEYTLLQEKCGYLIGDKVKSTVRLYAKAHKGAMYVTDVYIEVVTDSMNTICIRPEQNSGYQPVIQLYRFGGDSIDSIYFTMDSGGSGAYTYPYVFSLAGGAVNTDFDYSLFSRNNVYQGAFADYYRAYVVNEKTGERFGIDLSVRAEDFNELYTSDGKLIKPTQIEIGGTNSAVPIYNAGEYQLQVLQRVTGRYQAEGLGYVITYLAKRNNEFVPFFKMLGVFGKNRY